MTTDATEPTPREGREAFIPRPDGKPSAWDLLGIDPDRVRRVLPDTLAENERLREVARLRRIVDGVHLAVHGNGHGHRADGGGCPDLIIEVQELVRERDPARMVMDLVAEREAALAENARLRQQRAQDRGQWQELHHALAYETGRTWDLDAPDAQTQAHDAIDELTQRADVAEERYRQLAGEVRAVAEKIREHERTRRVLTPQSGFADDLRTYAEDLYRAIDVAATAPTEAAGEHDPENCPNGRYAVACLVDCDRTAPTEAPTPPPADEPPPAQGEGSDPRPAAMLRQVDFDTGPEDPHERVGSEAQEGAEALHEDGLPLLTKDPAVAAARVIRRLRADLVRVTQERDEAWRKSGEAHGQRNTLAEKLDAARAAAGLPLNHGPDLAETITAIRAERDALQATLDAERKQFDIERTSIIDADKRSRGLGRVWEVLDRRGLLASDDIADDVAAALDQAQATLDALVAKVRKVADACYELSERPIGHGVPERLALVAGPYRIAESLRAALDSVPTQTDRNEP